MVLILKEKTMNNFGGNWTEKKIEILVEYARAYLTIMNKYVDKYGWELLYFDGFAGSGFIKQENAEDQKIVLGAAQRILEIDSPRPFDMYYFVEKKGENAAQLKENTKDKYPSSKNIHIVNTDCNEKIEALSSYLKTKEGKSKKTLAYIDPCGMQLKWSSLERLHELSVDLWVLVPTGLGVNRLLKRNGEISKAWLQKLEVFLGLSKEEILRYFYEKRNVATLFGEESITLKEAKAIEKSAKLYSERLNSLFKFVSKPYVLKNTSNSVMFHFMMATNNEAAVKIANQIIDKYTS